MSTWKQIVHGLCWASSLLVGHTSARAVVLQQEDACEVQKVVYIPGHGNSDFGISVAVEGELAVVGAGKGGTSQGFGPGAVLVYEYSGLSWQQLDRLLSADADNYDNFGASVSVSGTRILVGAPLHESNGVTNSGAAYIFEREDGVWVQVAKLKAADSQAAAVFGTSVALDGDTAIIGAHGRNLVGYASGAAYVFERIEGVWVQTQILSGSDHQAGDWLGRGVAIQGDWIVAGGPGIGGPAVNSGGAYVYARTSTGWQESGLLIPPGGGAQDNAGWQVSVNGNRVAVGAHTDNTFGTASGAVHVFAFESGAWLPWTKLTAPGATVLTKLGISIALQPGFLLAGGSSDP